MEFFARARAHWIYQDTRIGYDRSDNKLNNGFKPEWHHFFPKSILRNQKIEEPKINAFANIVVLNEKANRQFRSTSPEKYLEKFNVQAERLQEQLIPTDKEYWKIDRYLEFLDKRADNLAHETTEFLNDFVIK